LFFFVIKPVIKVLQEIRPLFRT